MINKNLVIKFLASSGDYVIIICKRLHTKLGEREIDLNYFDYMERYGFEQVVFFHIEFIGLIQKQTKVCIVSSLFSFSNTTKTRKVNKSVKVKQKQKT